MDNMPVPGPGHPAMGAPAPPALPEDVTTLYGADDDPDPRPPAEQARLLQQELDGIATGIVALEGQKKEIEDRLAAARALCRGIDSEILRLKTLAAEQEAAD